MKIYSLLVLAFMPLALHAQTDKQSDDILKSVSAKYKSHSSISAEFSLTIEDPKAKQKESQTGKILLKGDKYHLEIKGQEVISDGKTTWTFLKDANEVQISEADNSGAITPANVFTMYEKGFDSKFIEEKTENGKTYQVIDIKPQDTKKNFFKIRLNIDKAAKNVTRTEVFNKDGSRMIYQIKNFTPNAPATDANFTFDKAKHPGVEVIDLR